MKLKCDCGGILRRRHLKSYDFSALAGVPVILDNVPGLVCSKCGKATLEGSIINEALFLMTMEYLRARFLLTSAMAKFLRKSLTQTQEQLANRMNLSRVTVARWETEPGALSPQNDLLLRATVLGELLGKSPADLISQAQAAEVLREIRTEAAPAQQAPVELDMRAA